MDPVVIKEKAIKSLKWTALGEIASRLIQPLITLFLARILTPADFGLVGVAIIVIGLAQILQDFGLGKTIIQKETEINESANVVFWTNLVLSIAIYFIIFITTPLISKFFYDERINNILKVLCLQIVLNSLIIAHQALLQRSFQFKQLFFIRFITSFVPGFVSIPMALSGFGVWSLVYGALAGSVIQVFLYWKFSPWKPAFTFDFKLAKGLYNFSGWVLFEAFLSWLILWGDSIVLGHFLGVRELGVYRTGVTLIMLIFGVFFNPIQPVIYSAFSRLQFNQEELKQQFLKLTKIIAFISLPLGIGLAVLAEPISKIVFGDKWQGIEIVIAIIGIKDGIAWLVGHNPEVYRAMGRPDVNVKMLVAAVIYYMPVYLLVVPFGLLAFCIARLGIAVIGMALHIFVARKVLNLSYNYLINCAKKPLIESIITGSCIYFFVNLSGISENLAGLITTVFFGTIIYIIISWCMDRHFILQVKEVITKL